MAENEKKVTEEKTDRQEVQMDPWDMLVFGPPRKPVAQPENVEKTEKPAEKKKK
ncbi:hypothetical protein [Alkalihalobacterium elongatum]|uniref:hypothetical protein n=1 Tax=Alkalihalobacterium elongatum TaxID=2675466 RepID=UPI001C1FD0D2|nr:hypothetical protein [Alkalihalobacterium elongatum]